MLEPVDGSPSEVLVSFLWRPITPVPSAFIRSSLLDADPKRGEMARVAGSDLWVRTIRVRRSLRATYSFYPGTADLNLSEDAELERIFLTETRDPHNPRTMFFPKVATDPDDRDVTRSILELPGAIPQPFARPRTGVAHGTVQPMKFDSPRLDGGHPIWVYLPPEYGEGGREYDVAVLFDGRWYLESIPTPTILDNMIAEGLLDPLVAVMWDYPRSDLRNDELECNESFADCIAEELMPWLQARFHTTTDPRRSVVGGSSAGGLGAAYIAWKHPGRFGKVLSQSGWFGGPRSGRLREPGWLPAQFTATPTPSLEFYLDAGSLETGTGGGPEEILPANRRFRDILVASGNVVHYSEFEGGHDYAVWRGTLSDGLLSLLPRRSRPDGPPPPSPGTSVD